MMYPYLFGVKFLPMYGILMAAGAVIAVIIAVYRHRKDNLKKMDVFLCALFAIVFGLIGAKLFAIVGNLNYVIEGKVSILDLLRSGFVFYGGLIGGVLGGLFYVRLFHISFLEMADALIVGFPLAHAIGRMGCLCSGCCFGKPTDSAIGIIFTNPLEGNTPIGVPLVPTQIIEAVCLIVIFLLLLGLSAKKRKAGFLTVIYCLLYAVVRFVIEFFRGDIWRVFNDTITGSQIISVAVILAVGLLYAVYVKRKKANPVFFSDKVYEVYKRELNLAD